jgi:organic hydroperoxide reductase OsmC/OhrA
MAKTETYEASVSWTGGHRGRLKLGNGPEMDFSAPPSSHGEAGVLTPEDAFVGAVNTCVMLMFIWGVERYKLGLDSYECRAEGMKRIELDRTEIFSRVVLRPRIVLRAAGEAPAAVERRARRALDSARKYSLVANSIKSDLVIEPEFVIS